MQEVIPVKRRSPYKLGSVKGLCVESIVAARGGQACKVGADVSKEDVAVCLYWPDRTFERPLAVKSPGELRLLMEKLVQLKASCPLVLAMESSGTYGDALRQAAGDVGIEVHRVSGKAVRDYSETFDGVPSQHDGKDAAMIAELCHMGKSALWPWRVRSEEDETLRYWVRRLDTLQRVQQMYCGKREALLARHWPEAEGVLRQTSATLTKALLRWGSPAALAADADAATALKQMGRRFLDREKIAALIEAARTTVGVRMTAWAIREMQDIAGRIVELRKQIGVCRRELRRLTTDHAAIAAQEPAVGRTTACVLWVCLGDPCNYGSAAAYRKAMGLNLAERSSGQHKGKLKLSKRGQRLCRRWLYFSAMRQMQQAPVARWARAKKQRDNGEGLRAVIGVMRRLALAAWHVAKHGVAFDANRLFPGAAT